MRLYLDVQQAQESPPTRGLPRYVANHAAALDARGDVVARVALRSSLPVPPDFDDRLASSPRRCDNAAASFAAARAEGPLAYHVMSPFSSVPPLEESLPPWALDGPLVVTLYDLIPLGDRGFYLREPFDRYYWSRLALLGAADLVLAISRHAADDAVERLDLDPRRIAVIGGASDPCFAAPSTLAASDVASGLATLTRPFAMTVASGDPRRNVRRLLHAWAALPRSVQHAHQLVVVGDLSGAEDLGELVGVADELGLGTDDLVFTGPITDDLLRWLYQHTTLVVCPSLAEGFGLPAIEGCAAGAPVITSDTTSLPEIVDWPPSTFDPTSIGSMADAIERALSSEPFRAELAAACTRAADRCSWESVAARTVDALGQMR